jgi:hypothetical protein
LTETRANANISLVPAVKNTGAEGNFFLQLPNLKLKIANRF